MPEIQPLLSNKELRELQIQEFLRKALKWARSLVGKKSRDRNMRIEDLPPQLQELGGQRQFLEVLNQMQDYYFNQWRKNNPFSAPEEAPSVNLCGYAASAIVEKLRNLGFDARVVYGHYTKKDGSADYHYWAEVTIDNIKYAIDATHRQFNHRFEDSFLMCKKDDLSRYQLEEFSKNDPKIIGSVDRSTIAYLESNGGILPILKHTNSIPELQQMYVVLTQLNQT